MRMVKYIALWFEKTQTKHFTTENTEDTEKNFVLVNCAVGEVNNTNSVLSVLSVVKSFLI